MGGSSRLLLDLETANNSSTSSIDSKLLVCKNDDDHFLPSKTTRPISPPRQKPAISALPKSQVMGKVKDFLGIMAEANKRLQLDARDKSEDYDIEALTGNESEYIEMDLMLGVADLHTPEAVAAAESAVAFYQNVIPLAADNCLTESDDSSGDDNHDDKATCSPTKLKRTKPTEDQFSGETPKNHKSKKRSKIIELS